MNADQEKRIMRGKLAERLRGPLGHLVAEEEDVILNWLTDLVARGELTQLEAFNGACRIAAMRRLQDKLDVEAQRGLITKEEVASD